MHLSLFSIRFRLWANERLSSEDDIFWCYCAKAYPECPILRRTALNQDDQKAQDACVAETVEAFDALFANADKVEMKSGPHGMQSFSATFDLTKNDPRFRFGSACCGDGKYEERAQQNHSSQRRLWPTNPLSRFTPLARRG